MKLLRSLFLVVAMGAISCPAGALAQGKAQAAPPDERVQELYAQARSAQAAGNLSEAAARYEEILKIAPRLAAAYNNLGSIYVQQREFRKAVDVLQKGLEINRDMPSASALLGIALYEMGDYSKARPRLETATRANPKDSNASIYFAIARIHLDQFESAQ